MVVLRPQSQSGEEGAGAIHSSHLYGHFGLVRLKAGLGTTCRGRRREVLSESRMRETCTSGLCVQRRLACNSAGERPAGARVRSPVVWIARVAGNQEDSEAYRQRLPREDDESPGRNDSERENGLESA